MKWSCVGATAFGSCTAVPVDGHELAIVDAGAGLRSGLCKCGWESARYALPTTVRHAHEYHLGQVEDLQRHDILVDRLLAEALD